MSALGESLVNQCKEIAIACNDLCGGAAELRSDVTPDPAAALPYPLESLRALVAPMVREELEKIQQELPQRKVKYEATIGLCIDLTAFAFGVQSYAILGEGRHREIVLARQAAMWLAREVTSHTLAALGSRFQRDQSTVRHDIEKAVIRREVDFNFRTKTDALFQKFKAVL